MKKYTFVKFMNSFFSLACIFAFATFTLQLLVSLPVAIIYIIADSNYLYNRSLFEQMHPFATPLYLYGILTIICFAYILLMLITKKDRLILKTMFSKKFSNICLSLFIGLLFGGGLNFLGALIPLIRGELVLKVSDSFNVLGLIFILFLVFFQSAGEEIASRGFVMQRLIYRYKKPWLAILLSSLLFGIAHLLNANVTFVSFLEIIASGVMLALLAYAFDNYYLAFAAHCGWNYMQNIVLGLPNSGNPSTFSIFEVVQQPMNTSFSYNPFFGVEGACSTLILNIIVDLILVFICIKSKKKRNIWVEAGLDIDNVKKVVKEKNTKKDSDDTINEDISES